MNNRTNFHKKIIADISFSEKLNKQFYLYLKFPANNLTSFSI